MGSDPGGIRVLGGACRRLIVFPASVSRAQVRVGSSRRGIRVPSLSRVFRSDVLVCSKVYSNNSGVHLISPPPFRGSGFFFT